MSKRKRSSGKTRQIYTPSGAPDLRQQGLRAFRTGRFDTAIAIWSNLGRNDPSVGVALAEAYFRRGLARTGTDPFADLRRAVELAPNQLRYQYHLARALHLTGNLPAAIERYRAVLQHDLGWKGAGINLALAVLEQNPQADITTLPGSSPRVLSTLAPVRALLRGAMPEMEGDGPLETLWRGLGLVQAKDSAAREALDDSRALPAAPAAMVRRYYKGVADAQAGDLDAARQTWQGVYEQRFDRPWLLDNLIAALLPQIKGQGEAGDLDGAAATARSAIPFAAGNAALSELVVQTLDRVAHAAAAAGDWARAATLWREARQVLSANSGLGSPRPLLHNLALAHEAQEQWLEAAEAWRAMLRTRPRKAAGAEQPAAREGADGQPPELSDMQWAWVRKRVIECYKRAGAPGEAVTVFRQAIKADPDDLDLRIQLADALLLNEQEQAAHNELQRVIQIDPQHVEARLRLANLLGDRHDWYAAEELLRQVLAEHPEREDARRQMARTLLAHGEEQHQYGWLPAAEKIFEEGQQIAPDDYQFPLNLARIVVDQINLARRTVDQRKTEHVEELLQRVLELGADQPDAYMRVIECWGVAHKFDQARAALARAEAALSLTPEFYIGLGSILLQHTTPPALLNPFAPRPPKPKAADSLWSQLATEMLDRATALRPDDARVRLQIATELLQTQPELALRYAEEGVRMLPNEPGGYMLLGLLQGLNQHTREAKETLRRGARLARQQGNAGLAQEMETLRQEIDSPLLQLGMQLGSIFGDLDVDDELYW